MAVLRWRSPDGWYTFYAEYLKDCLRKTQNLADLTDKEEAVKNLGLTGDLSESHNHDSRYVPMIEEAVEEAKEEILEQLNDLKDTVENTYVIGSSSPSNPTDGMIWFDTNLGLIKYYKSSKWNYFGAIALPFSTAEKI